MEALQISLAAARVNARMTQAEVAEKLRISKQTVNNWENGKSSPSFATLNTLAGMYRIPVEYIFLPVKST